MTTRVRIWLALVALTAGFALAFACSHPAPSDDKVGSYFPYATGLNLTGQAAGSLTYYDGGAWAALPAGTAGTFLQTQGTAAPTWTAPVRSLPVASRPTATGSGLLFIPNDLPVLYFDDPSGNTWHQFVQGWGYTGAAPLASAYTVLGNLYLSQSGDAVHAVSTGNVSQSAFVAGSLGSSSTWIVTLHARYLPALNVEYPSMAVIVSTGTTTSATAYGLVRWTDNSIPGLEYDVFNPGTVTRASNSPSAKATIGNQGDIRFRLLADGTQMHAQTTVDGYFWLDWTAVTTPSSLADYGFMLGLPAQGSAGASARGQGEATVFENQLTSLTVPQSTVTAATNATPIVITTSAAHGLQSGDVVAVHGVGGNTNANVAAFVHVTGTTTFEMLSIVGNGAYTSGGTVTLTSR